MLEDSLKHSLSDSDSNFESTRENSKGRYFYHTSKPFELDSGQSLIELTLAYETYGKLSENSNNVILIHHALSTDSHLAAHEKNPKKGWWEAMVGANKAIDTNKFFVICINNLGSCFGSTGPASLNQSTGQTYGDTFPAISIADMARSQYQLLNYLGIKKLYAVIGNSMGAMVSLNFTVLYPHMVERLISVSSCYRSYPLNIATHKLQKEIMALCPDNPEKAFITARKYGLLSYRHPDELNTRFLENKELENYLDYNAKKFIAKFDMNSYICIIDAMDQFDLSANNQDIIDVFKAIESKVLIISVNSDLLFPPEQQRELYDAMAKAGLACKFVPHVSHYGHDAFYTDQSISEDIEQFLID